MPGILDCTYDEEWTSFRHLLQANADDGSPLDDDVFAWADKLISKHLMAFLHFHQSKSNEFFFDCARPRPRGVVCLYGMLSAFFIHHVYLREKLRLLGGLQGGDKEVYEQSTTMARLLIMNKNNCLDFFDDSAWPFSLRQLVEVLTPELPPESTSSDVASNTVASPSSEAHNFNAWRFPLATWAGRGAESVDPPIPDRRLIVYITGTHVALAREPSEMLKRFVGPLLGVAFIPVVEIADSQHCDFTDCETTETDAAPGALRTLGHAEPLSFAPVGLRKLASMYFRAKWNGLDIENLPALIADFTALFAAHPLSRVADLFVCTTPAVLCMLLRSFERPLLGYLGEPMLLSVGPEDRDAWWGHFEGMVTSPNNFFACYNPFLSSMIYYQTGMKLPSIRLHGLYTDAMYAPSRLDELLVVKGPNICVDAVCLLNRFAALAMSPGSAMPTSEDDACDAAAGIGVSPRFVGLDELGGAPYRTLASFRATVLYPYDVALAIFYELYSMTMPIFVPRPDLLPFYVFRGLHSSAEFHAVRPGIGNASAPGAASGHSPFIPPLNTRQWFFAAPPWSNMTDFATYPNVIRFGSAAELLAALEPGATDWVAVSAAMKRFNDATLVKSASQWEVGVARALSGLGGSVRPSASSASTPR